MHRGFNKFFITGFSGAGKSTLLNQLSKQSSLCGWNFVDLDNWIEKNYADPAETLGQYIERVGLEQFRKSEKQAMESIARQAGPIILALGAGALEKNNAEILKGFKGLFLATDFETCWQRIAMDSNRPLVKRGKEGMRELYEQRLEQYSQYPKVYKPAEVLEFIESNA